MKIQRPRLIIETMLICVSSIQTYQVRGILGSVSRTFASSSHLLEVQPGRESQGPAEKDQLHLRRRRTPRDRYGAYEGVSSSERVGGRFIQNESSS